MGVHHHEHAAENDSAASPSSESALARRIAHKQVTTLRPPGTFGARQGMNREAWDIAAVEHAIGPLKLTIPMVADLLNRAPRNVVCYI